MRRMNKFAATLAAIGAAAVMAVPAFAAAPAAQAPITEAQAKTIALEKAGFTEDAVDFLEIEKDFDDGRLEYDIDFFVDGVEYSCEIDVNTGGIIEYEVDFD